jgi:hypothetical protein
VHELALLDEHLACGTRGFVTELAEPLDSLSFGNISVRSFAAIGSLLQEAIVDLPRRDRTHAA